MLLIICAPTEVRRLSLPEHTVTLTTCSRLISITTDKATYDKRLKGHVCMISHSYGVSLASVTCHPTQVNTVAHPYLIPILTSHYSIYLSWKDGRLS